MNEFPQLSQAGLSRTGSARRDALKLIGGAALATAASPFVAACRGVVRDDLGGPAEGYLGLDSRLVDILYHASFAPSSHNAQPWRVTVSAPDRLQIGSERTRCLPGVDPANRETLLSIGAFLENLVLAASTRGYRVEYEVIARQLTESELLRIRLSAGAAAQFPMDAIRLRRTVRRNHLPQELRSTDVSALAAAFGAGLAYHPRGSAAGKYLEECTIEANRVQAARDDAQEELSRWMRWSDTDARKYRNGLTPEGLEITGLPGWYVRHFMTASDVLKPGFRARSVDNVRRQLQSYGGWLVMTSANADVATLIETGRRFQRMLLGIRARMIAVHPMTQILEEAPFRDSVARELGVGGPIQFVLRAGYLTSYPRPVSLRMPVAWFTRLQAGPAPE